MKWMGKTTLVALVLALLGLAVSSPASAQEKKPNILVIMGDDVGNQTTVTPGMRSAHNQTVTSTLAVDLTS